MTTAVLAGMQIREFVDGELHDERFCWTHSEAVDFVEMAIYDVSRAPREAAIFTIENALAHGNACVECSQGLAVTIDLVFVKQSLWQRIKSLFGFTPKVDDEECNCPSCNPDGPFDQEYE